MEEARVERGAVGGPVTNVQAVVVSVPMPVQEREETRAKTDLGAPKDASLNRARLQKAKLARIRQKSFVKPACVCRPGKEGIVNRFNREHSAAGQKLQHPAFSAGGFIFPQKKALRKQSAGNVGYTGNPVVDNWLVFLAENKHALRKAEVVFKACNFLGEGRGGNIFLPKLRRRIELVIGVV